uniref:Retrotransposon gag domain-containing protein n=1 Tax=Ananas comosus var. bracteatus TaxID=296719 RepID=A0A6V7Q383_ANACO|nr:unnamed protein product [Ananas comosus var. bracteatus]
MMIGTAPSRGQGEEENSYSARPGTKNYQALPEDSFELQQLAQRAGANTRLKSAAMSFVAAGESSREQDLTLHLPLDLEGEGPGDAENEGAITPSAMPSESPLHRVSPHFASNMADQVTTEELMRRIEERDSQINQMATQMSTMMDALNTLLRQQQQQQIHHPSVQQSHSTEQTADANPHNTEHQASPYQQNPTVNERASHEVPISAMTPSALQQLLDNIVTSKVKQLSQDKEPLLTEGDKPYPAWHDHVPYPPNYNRPRFQMFDGTGDAREHLTHFEAACGDVATNPSLLLRQFSLSLKGAAFHWYTKLAQVKRDVSLGELAELKQGRDERVEDYVARWRNMSILYPDALKPTQAVELCIKGMQSWYSMEREKVELEYQRSPEILALYKNAKAIDNTRRSLPQKTSNSGGGGPSRKVTEANVVHQPKSAPQNREKMPITSEAQTRKSQSWIEERKNKTYSFKREKVPRIFEQVMKTKKLVLPEPTKPEEVHKTDDPLYCPYHRSIGHKIEDCFIFKDWVERALQQGVFTLSPKAKNDSNVESSNMVTVKEVRASLPASKNSSSLKHQVDIPLDISPLSTERWMSLPNLCTSCSNLQDNQICIQTMVNMSG